MRALLLAGGKATRLRPLTERTPKAMTPLLGRPFLEHLLAWLAQHEIRDVTLLLGYLPDPIRAYFGDGHQFGIKLAYLVEEEPLGSGGAIKQVESLLTEPFFALNADVFFDMDLGAMARAHQRAGAELSIALTEVEDTSPYGVVALDEAGWIRRFVEKPKPADAPSHMINAGVWLFSPEALHRIEPGRFTMVEQDLFPQLAQAGKLLGYPTDAYWMDAGTPQRYLQLQRDILGGRVAGALAILERPGWAGLSVRPLGGGPEERGAPPVLESGASVQGAVVLGAGVLLGAGSQVEGPTTLGARTRVGARAIISDSVIWQDGEIGAGALVGGSILADRCVVGAGAQIEDCVLGEGARVGPGVQLHGRTLNPGEII